MDDRGILQEIEQLVEEEHGLLHRAETGEELSDEEHARIRGLEVHLDQLWDLLRQREARREFRQDPDRAKLRDASTVERYTA